MTPVLRVLAVDDEPLALERLVSTLASFADVDLVGTAVDGESAVREARRLAPDIAILDVEMPGRNGLDVAVELESIGEIDVVILSAFDLYAAAAFDVEALDYLIKPLRSERLRLALDRAHRRRQERSAREAQLAPRTPGTAPAIHIADRHGGREVLIEDIVWIEAARDYALIHTGTRTHITRTTMRDFENRLPDTILRVHRSAFVAMAHVRRWAPPIRGVHRLVLSDGSAVPVGATFFNETLDKLRSLR